MKLFIESIMIFLGTLMTAAVVALGEPSDARSTVEPKQVLVQRPAISEDFSGAEQLIALLGVSLR